MTRKRKSDPNWASKLPKECPTCGARLFYGQCAECMKKRPKEEPVTTNGAYLDFAKLAQPASKKGDN